MQFTIKKNELLRELQKTSGIVDPRGTMPILSNILFDTTNSETLSVQATDLKITYRGECSAVIGEVGSVGINGKKILDITKVLEGEEINFSTNDSNWVTITCLDSKFLIPGIPAEEFPSMPEYTEEKSIEIDTFSLKDMIKKTVFSISNDDSRLSLTGANIKIDGKNITMISTDGHRLSCIEKTDFLREPAEGITDIILSRKSLLELLKFDDAGEFVNFFVYDNQTIFKVKKSLFITRLIDAQYPDIMDMIPSPPGKFRVTVQKNILLHALRRVSVLADEESKMIKLSLLTNTIELITTNSISGEAKEKVPAIYDGDEMHIGFNALYLIDVLPVLSDEIFIDVYDNQSPFLVGCLKNPEYRYMIMPMRVQSENEYSQEDNKE